MRERLGIAWRFVINDELNISITLCEILPLDDSILNFYGNFSTPGLPVGRTRALDLEAIAYALVFCFSGAALSGEPSRSAHFAVLEVRRPPRTPLSTSITSRCPGPPRSSLLSSIGAYLSASRSPCAPGKEGRPRSATARPARRRCATQEIAIVRQGRSGLLRETRDNRERVVHIGDINGLVAEESFDDPLCHGLLARQDLKTSRCNADRSSTSHRNRPIAMPTGKEIRLPIDNCYPNRGQTVEQMLGVLRTRGVGGPAARESEVVRSHFRKGG